MWCKADGRSRTILGILVICSLFSLTCTLTSAVSGQEPDGALVVRVGAYDNPPKVFTDGSGDVGGFFPDVLEYIAAEEGWELEYVVGNWTQCLERLENGEIDVMVDVAYSEERQAIYDFANESMLMSWGVVYSRPDLHIQTLPELDGTRMAVMKDSIHTTGDEGIMSIVEKFQLNVTFVELDNYIEVFGAIDAREVDVGVVNRVYGGMYEDDYDVLRTPIIFNPTDLRFAFPKNATLNPYLIERIDYHVVQLKKDQDSVYYESLRKYMPNLFEGEEPEIPSWLVPALLLSLGIAAMIVIMNFLLRRQVSAKTAELNKALVELGASEEHYRGLVDGMLEGVAYCRMLYDDQGRSVDWVYLSVNKNFDKLTGLKNIVGKRATEAFPGVKEADPELFDIFSRVVVTGEPAVFEKEIKSLGMWMRISVFRPEKDHFIVVFDNITERKRAEQTLRESELKFHTFMKHSPGIAFMKDRDGRILYINETFERVLNRRLEEIRGKSFHEIWPPETAALVPKGDLEILEQDRPVNSYLTLPQHDGPHEWYVVTFPLPDAGGRPSIVAGFGIDLTDQRKVERAFRESEARFAAIFNSAIEGISIQDDPSGAIILSNRRLREMLGYSDEELKRLRHEDLHPAHITAEERTQCEKLRSGQVNMAYNMPLRRKNGSVFYADLSTFPVSFEGSEFTASFYRDVSERRAFEEQLKSAVTELTRANRDLSQFAYVASHDLQEPLRMISSYLQLIERRYRGHIDKDTDEFINFAVEGANRLQKMINDLLEFSRVGTRGRPFVPTDCNTVVENVLANLELAIEESGATVTHDKLPVVEGDEGQLIQLLQNLVENAVKFRSKEPPRIHISAIRRSEEWEFSVSDNGIGIDPRFHEKLFVIFQRLHARREYVGTGIGLAICKRIVERHSGRIWVESKLGHGSTFHFTIPDKKSDDAAKAMQMI